MPPATAPIDVVIASDNDDDEYRRLYYDDYNNSNNDNNNCMGYETATPSPTPQYDPNSRRQSRRCSVTEHTIRAQQELLKSLERERQNDNNDSFSSQQQQQLQHPQKEQLLHEKHESDVVAPEPCRSLLYARSKSEQTIRREPSSSLLTINRNIRKQQKDDCASPASSSTLSQPQRRTNRRTCWNRLGGGGGGGSRSFHDRSGGNVQRVHDGDNHHDHSNNNEQNPVDVTASSNSNNKLQRFKSVQAGGGKEPKDRPMFAVGNRRLLFRKHHSVRC